MMSCEEVLHEISNYLDEEVSAALRREIEEHLRDCRKCTVLLNTTRKTLSLVCDYYVMELPEGVSERLMERLASHLR